jgi:restriction system protein
VSSIPVEPKPTRWSRELLKALEWKRIEQLSAMYFRTLKFRVEEAPPGPDGGVDLRLYTGSSTTPEILVQCKAWNSWKVGVSEIRELFGVMAASGVNEAAYVTTSTFSRDAIEFSRGKNILLIDGDDLLRKLLNLMPEDQEHILRAITAGDYTTPTCPSCGVKMVKRQTGTSGELFWGCPTFPRCRGTIRIGRQ